MNRPANALHSLVMPALLLALSAIAGESVALAPSDPGRLFYTPAQRASLEAMRTPRTKDTRPERATADGAPVRFDGIVTRSDGTSTRWVNGRAQAGAGEVSNLRPGQVRAHGKVYEPYQVLRQPPAPTSSMEPAP